MDILSRDEIQGLWDQTDLDLRTKFNRWMIQSKLFYFSGGLQFPHQGTKENDTSTFQGVIVKMMLDGTCKVSLKGINNNNDRNNSRYNYY